MSFLMKRRSVRRGIVALIAIAAVADAQVPEEGATEPIPGLSAEELAAEPPLYEPDLSLEPAGPPVDAADAKSVRIEALAEVGYIDENGRYVVDLLEQDYAYLAVRLETEDGRPVRGATPDFSLEGTGQLLQPADIAMPEETNEYGVIEFAVVGGQMGLDTVTATYRDASAEILVNVISLRAAGFPVPPTVDGGVPWEDLLRARIRYEEMRLVAEFPETISERAGQTVKLSGFMMPLEPEMKQRHFLLTSNPPSCFFHIPGGPAGAVEVLADEGIEVSWDPVILEGRFEPQESSEIGVVYRLLGARLVEP